MSALTAQGKCPPYLMYEDDYLEAETAASS
jgi:hypothetical protein